MSTLKQKQIESAYSMLPKRSGASSMPMPVDPESSSEEDLSVAYIIDNKPPAKEVREYFKAVIEIINK